MKPIYLLTILSAIISTAGLAQDPEKKLKELEIILPEIKTPSASFVHVVRTGTCYFCQGKVPRA